MTEFYICWLKMRVNAETPTDYDAGRTAQKYRVVVVCVYASYWSSCQSPHINERRGILHCCWRPRGRGQAPKNQFPGLAHAEYAMGLDGDCLYVSMAIIVEVCPGILAKHWG